MLHLSPQSTVIDMCTIIRNASFWESGAQEKTEVDEDAMDVDLVTAQASAATDGRVIGNDGTLNLSAITNAGRVMVGAREICKTSRREALNMLRFLQRLCDGNESPRRSQPRQRRVGDRRAFVAENSMSDLQASEPICETLNEWEDTASEPSTLLANTAKTVTTKEKRRVMKLSLVSQSHLGYPRKIDALVDTGAELSIISLALAKELGAKVRPDETRLLLAHGQATKVSGRCAIEVSVEKSHNQRFNLNCVVLPKPGYDLLLGIDAMVDNQISAHPHNRSASIRGRKIKCLFTGPKADKEVINEIIHEQVGRYTEKVDHLPGIKGDRIQVPLNRSIVLGPKQSKMVKTPIVLQKALVHKRTPVVAPRFSAHLGVQYAGFLDIDLDQSPGRTGQITGKTTTLMISTQEGAPHVVRDCDGNAHQLRRTRRSFPKRQ